LEVVFYMQSIPRLYNEDTSQEEGKKLGKSKGFHGGGVARRMLMSRQCHTREDHGKTGN
jgi:hypothetical protein